MAELLTISPAGLYCEAGDFHIDPWKPVARAVITHGHSDHARPGSAAYLTAERGVAIVEARTGGAVEGIAYGESQRMGNVTLSLHPAGHILGSAVVRVERDGEVWVVTGDYKADPDPTCAQFEPVRCHTLITECTFGLPIYRWPDASEVFAQMNAWWRAAAAEGKTAVVFSYALGKAQRVLAGVDASIGPIRTHGAVEAMNDRYRSAGVALPPTSPVMSGRVEPGSLVIAPPSAGRSPWMRRLGDTTTAFASGWMMVRGRRRQRSVDRGFVLSDHVDWPQLLDAVAESGAERVLPTHGNTEVVARWFREQGLESQPLPTRFSATPEDDEE
ncbi:MAG: ligase-associated DNA damage response exonuclease [Rhodothermales bacterium]|nr:ligase-associated DNA damage response exonuclease [Rhodothermales bacterium]